MGTTAEVHAWRPQVPGVAEVLHARFIDHAYPLHTHDTWTVLIVDAGTVAYDLGHGHHGTSSRSVTLLPPHVSHNGRPATQQGFRKRVIYLESGELDQTLIGRAVDRPTLPDPALRRDVSRLHQAVRNPGDELEAESLLAVVRERLDTQLRRSEPTVPRGDSALARNLRDLLDSEPVIGVSLAEASELLGSHPAHLVRSFGEEFGLPPHRYLNGRRLDRARRLLLEGMPATEVAQRVGFFDQSHLTRHFRRFLGVTPAAYAHGTGP